MMSIFENSEHKNILFNDLTEGSMVQANQHIIVHQDEAMILDPGGHKVYPKLLSEVGKVISTSKIKYIFFSHQDPDIVAAANGWLMVTDAKAYITGLWTRFIPHFGIDDYLVDRLIPIQDSGGSVSLGGIEIKFIPAHFLHSPGNFQVYDPVSKILYSGDLGASLGANYIFVENFEEHIKYMEAFHKRYIASNKVLKIWVDLVKKLDIEVIAPQHGAIIKGKENVNKFIDWLSNLQCGVDLISSDYNFSI